MRDRNRIPKIAKLLEEAWKLVPDWRLGQFISNLQGPGPQDVFHPSDTQWKNWLINFIKEHKQQ